MASELASSSADAYIRTMLNFITRHHMAIGAFLGYGIMGLVFWLAPPWLAMSFAALCVIVGSWWGRRFKRKHGYWPY